MLFRSAHTSCAIHTALLACTLPPASPSFCHSGGSCTRSSPSCDIDTHRQHGKTSGSLGFGGSLSVTFGGALADAEVDAEADVEASEGRFSFFFDLLLPGLCFFGGLGLSSVAALRLRGDVFAFATFSALGGMTSFRAFVGATCMRSASRSCNNWSTLIRTLDLPVRHNLHSRARRIYT